MVEGGAGPDFPVVFFDGEREMNIGSIRVYPLLEFKAFQMMLSQRIGISPNQISIYLCDRKSSKLEDRRRIPITGKVNFGFIAAREKDNTFFLVVLKRSRKSRNRKPPGNLDYGDNFRLLRRNQLEMDLGYGYGYYDSVPQTDLDMAQMDPILMYLNNSYPNPNLNSNSYPRIQETYPMMMTKNLVESKGNCEECRDSNGSFGTSKFHHCVNDPVILGSYRSRYGPVRGPVQFY